MSGTLKRSFRRDCFRVASASPSPTSNATSSYQIEAAYNLSGRSAVEGTGIIDGVEFGSNTCLRQLGDITCVIAPAQRLVQTTPPVIISHGSSDGI